MPFVYAAAAIAVIGAGVGVYGSIQSANAEQAAGQAQASADQYNAEVAQQNAIAAQQQAEQNATIQQAQAKQKLGSIVAAYGSAGIDSGSGSALDVLSNSASNAEVDRQTILYKGQLQANGYTDEASLDSASAINAVNTANAKASATLISGAGSALSKVGSAALAAGAASGGGSGSGGGTDYGAGSGGSGTGPGTGGLY